MVGASQTLDGIGLERRLAAFDLDGTLEADCREIWSLIEPEKARIARQFWLEYARAPNLPFELDEAKIDALTERIVPYVEAKYRNLGDPAWVEMAGTTGNGLSGPIANAPSACQPRRRTIRTFSSRW